MNQIQAKQQFKIEKVNNYYKVIRMYFAPYYKERVYDKFITRNHALTCYKDITGFSYE